MRISPFWLAVIVAFLLASRDAAVPFLRASPDAEPAAPARGKLEDIRRELRRAFQDVEAHLAARRSELKAAAARAASPTLRESLSAWEVDAARRPELRKTIAEELDRQCQEARMDALFVVTPAGDVFLPGSANAGEAGEREAVLRATILVVTEPFIRDGQAAVSAELLPPLATDRDDPQASFDASCSELSLLAATPILPRPDATHSLLVAVVSFRSLTATVDSLLEKSAVRLRWHLFNRQRLEPATVALGSCRGLGLRSALLKELEARGVSEEAAFEGEEPQAGRWAALVGYGGRLQGGWGLTAEPLFLQSALAPAVAAAPPPAPGRKLAPARLDAAAAAAVKRETDSFANIVVWCIAGTVGAGVLWVLFAAMVAGRRRRARARRLALPAVVEAKAKFPKAPEPVADNILAQFEINWKTFASYTQDLLQQKLQEIEEAPQKGVKEVRARIEALAEAITTVAGEIAAAREEAKESAGALVGKLGELLQEGAAGKPGLSAQAESALARIDAELVRTRESYHELQSTVTRLNDLFGERQDETVALRLAEEKARLAADFRSEAGRLEAERDAKVEECARLEEELAEARRAEAALQDETRASSGREETLRASLDEERAKVEQLTHERDEAWGRERSILEEIRTSESREEEAHRRAREADEALRGVEAGLSARQAREEELLQELAEAKTREARQSETIKEIYREQGRLQHELERQEQELAEERRRLAERVKAIEAERAVLEAREREGGAERARAAEVAAARQKELEALGRAFQALKEEKTHFEMQTRRLGEEVDSQRTMHRSLEESRQRSAQEEIARLQASFRERELALAKREEEVAAGRQEAGRLAEAMGRKRLEAEALRAELDFVRRELEQLRAQGGGTKLGAEKEDLTKALQVSRTELSRAEALIREREKQLRQVDEERLRYKTSFTELEARWQSRQGELELRTTASERQRDETQRKLAEAEEAAKRLAAEVEAARGSAQVEEAALKNFAALEAERTELLRNIEKLTGELHQARAETEEVRRFQGALVGGSIPAAILAVDVGLKVFAWNARAAALWGRTLEEVTGRNLAALGLKGIDNEALGRVRQVLQKQSSASLPRATFTDVEGRVRHIDLSCDPIPGPEREALGAVLVAEDVSERVEKEIEARVESLFTESLVRSLPAALVVVDGRNRVISWNCTAAEVLGVREEAALGQDLFSLKTPLAKEAFRRRFEEARKKRGPYRLRARLEARGVPAYYLVTQCPFLGEEDSVRGTVLLIQEAAAPVEASV
jgi:PAS domain S-box-containing protein